MTEFQLAMLQISLSVLSLSVLLAAGIIGSAINNLAKTIKDKKENKQ